jgi:trk system potassium uptake protein TrkA
VVEPDTARMRGDVIGKPLREAKLPPDARVASIIRGEKILPPFGSESIQVGDRVVVIGSPHAAREWSEIIACGSYRVDDVVIYGGGRIGVAVARVLLDQAVGVRLIEADGARAHTVAELLPKARVLHATGFDREFIGRERIGQAQAAIFAMRDDAKNLYAAVLAKLLGVQLTIGVVHEAESSPVFDAAGIDVVIDPRSLTAEEIVRFAHDPRTAQVAMLEGDRFEILDVTCRTESPLLGKPLRDLPMTGTFVGAIVRDGKAIIPRGNDVLLPGDRAILFTESKHAAEVEQSL